MKPIGRLFVLAIWGILWLAAPFSVFAQSQQPLVLVLAADGPITPAMAEYLQRGLRLAEQRQAELVVVELNTPGGSIDLMSDIVQTLRSSSVPVVIYVSPRGAMAGSAGAVITLAGHASAMAPETSIGAASPVSAEGQDLGETMEAKSKNILKAAVRSLDVLRFGLHRLPKVLPFGRRWRPNRRTSSRPQFDLWWRTVARRRSGWLRR